MRLIIVSNRLPVAIRHDQPAPELKRSIGGLATGIGSYIQKIVDGETAFDDYLWVGWPGAPVAPEHQEATREEFIREYKYNPVFLEERLVEGYYLGFCNRTIWPLFHYFPQYVNEEANAWNYYEEANEVFYAAIKPQIRKDDVVWIHDYHLMLLPGLIRRDFPELTVLFFLHIPFPVHTLFRQLSGPARSGILKGLLGANLIGFHTAGYSEEFLKCLSVVLNVRADDQGFVHNERRTRVGVFPMGIDYSGIRKAAESKACKVIQQQVLKHLGDIRIILSVDRLDYTKGILNRLIAFYQFLSEYPQWIGKVVMILIVAPSRREINAYGEMKKGIDEWVGKINGTYSTGSWLPVTYQFRQLDPTELFALYRAADIALVTPLCDGMNLIAKEFIAANQPGDGVLILSEMAGAIHELPEAIAVNPFCIDEMKDALHLALDLSPGEKLRRNLRMHEHLIRYDVIKWSEEIMEAYENSSIILVQA